MTEVYTADVTVPDLWENPGYGLLDNVVWLTADPNGHWQGGIQYEANCPQAEVTIMSCFPGVTGDGAAIVEKAATWEHLTRGARPFTLYDEWDCSPAGQGLTIDELANARDMALRALSQTAGTKAEYVFWTGDTNNPSHGGGPIVVYPHLNGATETFDPSGRILLQPEGDLITGGLDVVEGLGKLEEAIGDCYRGRAWIHVPSVLAPALFANYLCYERNGKLYTYSGNLVIIGRGYPASVGPGGVANAAGTTQMWATSPVFGLRATPRAFTTAESLDRSVNTLKSIAEQTYLLGWTCCLIGVTVTTGGMPAGDVGGPGPAA